MKWYQIFWFYYWYMDPKSRFKRYYFYFTEPVLIGLEHVRRTVKQSKGVSLQISYLFKMVKTDQRSRMLYIST